MSQPSASTGINRRDLLAAATASAAGLALLQEVRGADNPAQQVEDRGSKIKITALRGFRVGTKAFLKIDTDAKIFGWGEVTGLEPMVAIALANSLFELLDGQNPTRVEFLWNKLFRSHRDMRGGPFMCQVLAAIDSALWDITGKAWGVPVYRLLGGNMRDKIRVYPTAKAHKTGTGGPNPASGTPADIEHLVKLVKDDRERLGPDGAVMFDCHSSMQPPLLLQFAAAVEPYNLLWLEEPVVPNNIEAFKRIKQQIKIPIATGERDRTIWGALPYLHEGCIDIFQPDWAHCGGITQMKKIATLCEAYSIPIAPHSISSALGISASFHCTASVAEHLIHEYYVDMMPPEVVHKRWEIDKEGYASLPEGPGLGVEVDESTFEKVNADPARKFKWPQPKAPDGGVIDY
jgi:galactonate dehydratase